MCYPPVSPSLVTVDLEGLEVHNMKQYELVVKLEQGDSLHTDTLGAGRIMPAPWHAHRLPTHEFLCYHTTLPVLLLAVQFIY